MNAMLRMGLLAAFLLSVTFNAKAQQKQNPAFAAPEIDDSLPNVLLIGDSISIGYMLSAREALQGKANVFRPATNCGPTTRGLEQIDRWIGDRKWDVIHFNFGLHDLKYVSEGSQDLADPKADTSHPQVAIDQYAENIKTLAKRLKATGAKVIWRETTPVPAGSAGRIAGDAAKYNAAAAKAIEEVGGIAVDPCFAFAESIASLQRTANVHYSAEGSKQLGQHVAAVVVAALPEPATTQPTLQ
ncbi:SGNH/GDSL hydrolase family protein [Stieleria sp. TO1_6]|uniref:SGNH/GDSL hydrolase family protein n=1 Tax=Stieleria tagensis TaxID=2956795 RepID=UPI00209B7C27|nr:SGNH/GDSL hydrolase family protein [Stieleria tagensis]MCO8121778.1 SGNH/GDSL hydrolase family protein [Stieleria tagensis]